MLAPQAWRSHEEPWTAWQKQDGLAWASLLAYIKEIWFEEEKARACSQSRGCSQAE